MSTAVLEAPTLTIASASLGLGDKVMVLRNLDNPAWMTPVHGHPRDTNIQWHRRSDISPEIGQSVVTEVRHRPSYRVLNRELVRQVRRELRIDGTWYDAETLYSVGPDVTYLIPLTFEQEIAR